MVANALVQTRIDAEVKERATAVLDNTRPHRLGCDEDRSDTRGQGGRIAGGVSPVDAAAHDAWFRTKVQEALDDPRPAVPHEKVETHFAKRRAAALLKVDEGEA